MLEYFQKVDGQPMSFCSVNKTPVDTYISVTRPLPSHLAVTLLQQPVVVGKREGWNSLRTWQSVCARQERSVRSACKRRSVKVLFILAIVLWA